MDETLAAIKQATDIVDVIGEHLTLERFGAGFRAVCPFHDDHRPSLNVDPKFQNYKCWACGAQGDVFKFLQDYLRIPFQDAKERLAERAGIPLQRGRSDRNDSRKLIYQALSWAQKHFENCLWSGGLGSMARQYLDERGLTEATARRFGLGFAPDSFERLVHEASREKLKPEVLRAAGLTKTGKRGTDYDIFRGRLIFPVREERHGRVVGFGGRILPEIEKNSEREVGPKYLNTPATPVYNKSRILYGLETASAALLAQRQQARKGEPRRLVVMEGYTDCLMAYQAGLEIAVATCGTALTDQHVKVLRSHADQVILMFDGDAAGQKAAREATRLFLRSELDLRLCVLPEGFDPCDFLLQRGKEAFEEQLAGAVDAIEYQIVSASKRHDVTRISGQQSAVEEVLSVLAEVPVLTDAAHRTKMELALRRLTERFGVREEELRRQLGQIRGGNRRSSPFGASNERGGSAFPPNAVPRGGSAPAAGIGQSGPRPNESSGAENRPGDGPAGFEAPRERPMAAANRAEPPFPQELMPSEVPMDPREKRVVAALATMPSYASKFREVFPADEVRHPLLRQITNMVYDLADSFGETLTPELLRERLSSIDPVDAGQTRLDDLALELSASAPEDECGQQRWLQESLSDLIRKRDRYLSGQESRQLLAETEFKNQDHLEFLRQYRDRTRPDNLPCA